MTVLFLHGLGQNKESWRQTLDYLEYNNVVCPDLIPANGQKQTFGSLMDSLESCCSDGADSLVLCGISLGAVMSLEFYLRHPDKVKTMILIAPQYKMPTVLLGIQNIIFKLMPKMKMEIRRRCLIKRKPLLLTLCMEEIPCLHMRQGREKPLRW